MKISKLIVDDFYLSPIENLTVSVELNKSNMLLVYPNLPLIEVNDFNSFKGEIFINNKKINNQKEFEELKKDIFEINSTLPEQFLNGSFYNNLIDEFVKKNDYLQSIYDSLTLSYDKKIKDLQAEKAKFIDKENKSYLKLIDKLNKNIDSRINKLDKKDKKYDSKKVKLLNEKQDKLFIFDNEHVLQLDKINLEFDEQIKIENDKLPSLYKKAKIECDNIYKKEKDNLKNKLKEIKKDKVLNQDEKNVENKKAYEEFFKKTYLPKKDAKEIVNDLLAQLGFNMSIYLTLKQYNKFSLIERLKLNILYGILFEKRIFTLNLVDDKIDFKTQQILILDIKKIVMKSHPCLIISNNIDIISLLEDKSNIYIAIEGKTVEYSSKEEIINNSLVPIVQKLIKKENISQEDLDLTLDIDGKLEEILPKHFILASSNQIVAYKRLLAYQEHLKEKKNEVKPTSTSLTKKDADKLVDNIIKQAVLEEKTTSKLNKKEENKTSKKENKTSQKENKKVSKTIIEDNKTYLIEKREDDKWKLYLSNSNKTMKLFDTQKEAISYAKQLASKNNGTIKVKSTKGNSKGTFVKV